MKTALVHFRVWRFVFLTCCLSFSLKAQQLQLVTDLGASSQPAAGGGGDSYAPVLSADGRFVLFASTANNLSLTTNGGPIPARFPAVLNVFLRDRTNQATVLVSVNVTGAAGGDGDSLPVDVSNDGRFVLFESSASDLVPWDTSNATDVFLRDLQNQITIAIAVNTNGSLGNGPSRSPAMTPDGRFVAFVSEAGDLVPGDTNGIADVFVRDLQTGVTTLVSAGAQQRAPVMGARNSSESPQITPGGRYVAFFSTATNLAPDVPANGDIYVRDLSAGTTVWASSGARTATKLAFNTTNVVCYNHSLSADGRFVAYEASPATGSTFAGVVLRYDLFTGLTDLIHTNAAAAVTAYEDVHNLDMTPDGRFVAFLANTNGTTGGSTCVLVWDAQTGANTLASGDPANRVSTNSICDWPAISHAGQYVAFLSSATNLAANSVPGEFHLYVRDLAAGSTVLINAQTNGAGSPVTPASAPSLSTNGLLVAFDSGDGNLIPNDRNHCSDVFLRDWSAAVTELISAHHPDLASRSPNGPSLLSSYPATTDGRYVAFASEADNLVPGDTNSLQDIFVRDMASGTTVLVSGGTNGVGADGISFDPSISPDGRYVAFTSCADNLVAGDSNRSLDVFLRDLQSEATMLVSVNTNGTGPGNAASSSPIVGTRGRYVVFRSRASNLAGVTSTTTENLFLRDIPGGITYALTTSGAAPFVSATPDARVIAYGKTDSIYVWDAGFRARIFTNFIASTVLANGAAITPDGSRLASCLGSNLYVTELATRVTRLVGSTPLPGGTFSALGLSADGNWLCCIRRSSANGPNQLCLYDLQTGSNVVVDHGFGSADSATGGASDSPVISPDGRFVAYRSEATDIVPGDTNGEPDIFLYDRLTGVNKLLSAARVGGSSPDSRSLRPVFTGDGFRVLFQSWASDLVAGDFNQTSDIFDCALPIAVLVRGDSPGSGPTVEWPFAPGNGYRVEYKDRFADPEWQTLAGSITNSGMKSRQQDLSPAAGQRFYRVVTP